MVIIKRYPNRKLYDTEAKRYVTLNETAELIRQGAEVQVIDHRTNEDITAVILTQIIAEQEKQQRGFLPQTVLTRLVKAGGETMQQLQRGLISPLDLLGQIDEEIEIRLQRLISRGELAREEGARLKRKLLSPTPSLSESRLNEILKDRGIPTKDELRSLHEKLDALTTKLDQIAKEPSSD